MIPLRDNLKVTDFPLLTVILVIINVGIFFGWQGGSKLDLEKVFLYGNVPYEVSHPGAQCMPSQTTAFAFQCEKQTAQEQRWKTKFPATWKTFFASMFMHISISHLIGNMIFLVVFGIALEAGLGRAGFLLFYIVGGLAADLGHILFDSSSPVPALGASGAISAVMGGYVMLYPRARVFTWIVPPLPFLWGWIRASWLMAITMLIQALLAYVALASAYGSAGGGVAYFAHFGGFIAGAGLVMLVLDRETIESLRRQARIASGDEQRIVEHIETPPGQPVPAQAYPYVTQQPAAPVGAPAYGQTPVHAAPAFAAAPAAQLPDPFAAPQQPAANQPAQPYPPPVPPDPFAAPQAQPSPQQQQQPPPSPQQRPPGS